jgi:general secretion pathway protein K
VKKIWCVSTLFQFRSGGRGHSGTILIVILWILVILTALAVSLGKSTSIELSLTRHAVLKQKSRYLAWAGIMRAMGHIQKDSEDSLSAKEDTLYRCALRAGQGSRPEDLFHRQSLGDGYFSVRYVQRSPDGEKKSYDGLSDEERKVNLNGLTAQNIGILSNLIVGTGADEEQAKTIAFSVLDWKDADDVLIREGYGAEEDHYMGLGKPYRPKNRAFDSKEELLLVRGMTPQIFQKIEGDVTVFPKNGVLRVNLNTASVDVLTAVADSLTGPLTTTDSADAQSLVEKIAVCRQGEDGVEFTEDDRLVELARMELNTKERVLFLAMSQFQTPRSDYIRIETQGVSGARGVSTDIEAVVYRKDLAFQYWHRN